MVFLITFIIFLSYYFLACRATRGRRAENILAAFVFSCAQIFLTQLVLGSLHLLYLPILVILNLVISFFLIQRIFLLENPWNMVKTDSRWILGAAFSLFTLENVLMIGLFLLVAVWLMIAAHFLPPRGVDDLGYHLPPIFEYIQTHAIQLLPLEATKTYAYPLTAEFLFMWPTIFVHNTSLLGLVQFIAAIVGVLTVYALARRLSVSSKLAFFVAMQFFFAPVVLAQAGSAYIDILASVFFLLSLYFAVAFYLEEKPFYLYTSAVSLGIMIGMKYSMLLPALTLQPFILAPLWKKKNLRLFIPYLLLIFLFGSFWYLRNLFVLGNPLYPMDFFQRDLGIFLKLETKPFSVVDIVAEIPRKLVLLYLKDIGINSFHGGFGITFWGIALPAWIFTFLGSFKLRRDKPLFPVYLWAQMAVGFLILFLIPIEHLYLNVRYSLFMIPLAILSLGVVLQQLEKRRLYRAVVKALCIVFAALSVIHLARVKLPTYEIDYPIKDFLSGERPSKNKYLQYSSYMPSVWVVWQLLDELTLDDPDGWTVYVASDPYFFGAARSAPVYGSNLQNRIWNFHADLSSEPDALIYYFGPLAPPVYLKKKISIEKTLLNPAYDLILATGNPYFFVKKDFLKDPNKRRIVTDFYKHYFQEDIKKLKERLPQLEEDIPILSTTPNGLSLKFFSLTGELSNPVHVVTRDLAEQFVNEHGWYEVYSADFPLDGFISHKTAEMPAGMTLFFNKKGREDTP